MTTESLDAWLEAVRARTDACLADWGAEAVRRWPGDIGRAVAYALTGPGKRIRPALVAAAYEAAGGRADPTPLGAAIETVHTYSLVHDDLPCMDDDDLRRGRPTVHKAFSVAAAVEAGFRMVSLADWGLDRAAAAMALGPVTRGAVGAVLFEAAGVGGMIGGQVLDLEAEDRTLDLDDLVAVHRAKTGALLTASVMMGGMAAEADPAVLACFSTYGASIGLAFQVVDDILDATGTSEALGKTAGKDQRQGKSTYPALLGLDGARHEAERLVTNALDRLGEAGLDSSRLAGVARRILERQS